MSTWQHNDANSKQHNAMGYSILYLYRGVDVKFQAFPERTEFHGVISVFEFTRDLNSFKLNFPGDLNYTSIHHNLTEADNSRPKRYLGGLFSWGHLDCLPIFQSYIEQSKFYIHSPVWLHFWTKFIGHYVKY